MSALLDAVNSWAFNIDKGHVNEVVFLDLKKAFDTVDFSTFLSTLYSYGIRNSSFNWFKSYLNLRKQKCIGNGSFSDDQYLTCCSPQGTILGPLLFILYIIDMPNCLSIVQYRMYVLNLLVFMWMRICRGVYISIISLRTLLLAFVSCREVGVLLHLKCSTIL